MIGALKGVLGAGVTFLAAATILSGCTVYQDPPPQYPQQGYQQQPQQGGLRGTPPSGGYPGGLRGTPPYSGQGSGEVVQVPADRAEPVWTNQALTPGVDYVVEASGVWSAWPDHQDGVDAYYGYGQWRVGNNPEFWNQLQLDDRGMGDIARQNGHSTAYNPSHVYSTTVRGTGQRLKMQILDAKNGSWSDNRGGLVVAVYPQAGGQPVAAPYPPAAPPPVPAPAPAPYPTTPPRGDVVMVPADKAEPAFTQPLTSGVLYVVEASGVWSAWSDHTDGVDAYYGYAPWRMSKPELWNQLLIDDRAMTEIARQNGDPTGYNPAHVYATSVRGTGQRLKLQIVDAKNGSWSDNRGALQVRVYPR